MDQYEKDAGTMVALIMRMHNSRIPRARRLLEKVKAGRVLDDLDIDYLETVFKDASDLKPLIERNPEYQKVASGIIDLYSEIMEKALQNEKLRRE